MLKGPSPRARAFAPDPDARFKLIYLARRNPAMTADAFPAAWRDHSHLASTFAASLGRHFRSVHQCVRDRAASLPASFDHDYDGASILAMKSWADLLAARYHPRALDELLKDEARVFAGPVDDWTMAVEEHVLTPGAAAGCVMLAFLAPAPDIVAEDFPGRSLAEATARTAAMREEIRGATRIVWNHVVDPATAYPFAAILELWWPDRATALERVADGAVGALLEQRGIADAAQSVRLFARINHAKGAGA